MSAERDERGLVGEFGCVGPIAAEIDSGFTRGGRTTDEVTLPSKA